MLVKRTLASGATRVGHLLPDYELFHVEDLDGAREVMRAHDIDAVLLDLNLARVRGMETFERMRAQASGAPIVVLTGLADDETAIQAIRQGAQDYLIKDELDFRLLGRSLRYALERQRVHEAEGRAQRYLDTAAVMFLVIDPDERVSLINRCGCQILGLEEQAVLGRNWFDTFLPPAHREPLRTAFHALISDPETEFRYHENPVLTGSGDERLVAWHNAVLRDSRGRFSGILSSGVDVTEQRRAERALRRYTERLETLQAIDRDILAARSVDETAGAALNRIGKLVPDACCSAVMTFEGDPPQVTVLASTMQHEFATNPENRYPLTAADGLPGLAAGDLVVVDDLGTVPDRSPLQETLLTCGIHGAAAVPLVVDGELIGALNLYRREPGKPDEEHLAIARELADSLAVAIRQSSLFERVRRYSEELEHRVAERTAELRETNAELEAFAYSISHDLRNPLSGIEGFARALEERFRDRLGEEGIDYLRPIIESTESMQRLIDEVLEYSRASRRDIELEPVPLEAVVETVLERLTVAAAEAPPPVAVAHPLPSVLGYGPILDQIIGNLVSNALKFTRPGVAPQVVIRSERRKGWVRLWVEDNGIGIRPEDRERIFRVFERANGGHPGTGIGLATVRRGVERLGGQVGVESEPGVGSRFWIELRSAPEVS